MKPLYDNHSLTHKTPFGAVPCGQNTTYTLHVPCAFYCTTPYLIYHRDGDAPSLFPLTKTNQENGYDVFSGTLSFSQSGTYFYYFDLYTEYRKLYRGQFGQAYITTGEGECWQQTVYEADFTTSDTIKGGIFYQIFPDRFYEGNPTKKMPFRDRVYREDKNGMPYFWPTEQADGYLNMDYYGGDLVGIQKKLPYLKSLGVTHLYLNPIFEAHANHRYNTADYKKVDPFLGTNEDFKVLCQMAKQQQIDIILDGVFSHTGADSVYFNREARYQSFGAWQGEDSPYRKWYDFSPNYPCGYRSWWGFDTLPEVNENDPSFRHFICGENGVIDYWLTLGASGFRLDVADELPDDFIAEIRKAVKRNGADKYLLGEVWEDATTKWSYGTRRTYLLGNGLDSVMNYPFQTAVLSFLKGRSAEDTGEDILRICNNYPAPALHTAMNFLSTHDTVRAITALAGEDCANKDRYWQSVQTLSPSQYQKGIRSLRLGYAMIFTLPGIPSIYYGDEIGMQGYKDPFNRAYFNWDATETRMRDALITLAQIRHQCDAFIDGDFILQNAENGILQFERRSKNAVAAVCINRTNDAISCTMLGQDVCVPAFDFAIHY